MRINLGTKSCFDMTMGSYDGTEICLWTGLNLYITRLGTIIKKRDY